MKRFWIALLLLVVVGGGAILFRYSRPHLPAAERGRRLAEKTGCFACHGPEGTRGAANPGRTDGSVPTWEGDVMMFADGPDEIRQWIRDGVNEKRSRSRTWQHDREQGALRMPAFKDRLDEDQIEDLVAFVLAMSAEPPDDSLAAHGVARADALGCTGCHGAGGRLSRPNPGSLKGYVPSWDEADFDELVHDRAEFGEWVEHGISPGFAANPFAKFFLDRAVLKMPAYEKHLEPGDVDALWAYVQWLRKQGVDTED